MGTISHLQIPPVGRVGKQENGLGELVAMPHLDLDVVIETVRVLRALDDQSFLDCYNRTVGDLPEEKRPT